jgi:hypothetical protein
MNVYVRKLIDDRITELKDYNEELIEEIRLASLRIEDAKQTLKINNDVLSSLKHEVYIDDQSRS